MDPISIALGIANFAAPRLGKWLFGDDGEKVANQVIDVAKAVTGKSDAQDAAAALQADPALLIEFQRQSQAMEVRIMEDETERLRVINATMQKESTADDPYVRRWRPTIGYVVAGQLALLGLSVFIGVIGAVVAGCLGKADLIKPLLDGVAALIASMTAILVTELTVLGVNITQRSRDKAVAAGHPPSPGLIGSVASRILGGSGA